MHETSNRCAYPGCDRDGNPLCDHHRADVDTASEEEPAHVDPRQIGLFDRDEAAPWFPEWRGMPEFVQEDLTPLKSVIVHFANSADMAAFAELVDQRITFRTQSIWYPEAEIGRFADKRYADETPTT